MQVRETGAIAALTMGALSHGVLATTFVPVLVTGEAVGNDVFSMPVQVVLGNNGDIGTIADTFSGGRAVTFSQASSGGYTHSLAAADNQTAPGTSYSYVGFENLSISNAGGQSKLVFSSPASSYGAAGLFQSTAGSSATAIIYTDGVSGPTLRTSAAVGHPLGYGLSPQGHVGYGLRTGTAQSLHVSGATLSTGDLEDFNHARDNQPYALKHVVLGAEHVVSTGTTPGGEWGVYDYTLGTPSPRFTTIQSSGQDYAPRRLLGATAGATLVIAENTADAASGALFYAQGSTVTQLGATISPTGGTAGFNDDPIGQMTAGGKAAVYMPGQGLLYYDPVVGVHELNAAAAGIHTFGAWGGEPMAPMVNDQGWVVFEATLLDLSDALMAWQPSTSALTILAQSGDDVLIDGQTEQIVAILPSPAHFDSDVLRDGLNESGQVAFSIVTNEGNAAVLLTTVPEPGSVGLVAMSLAGLLRRRRR